MSNRHLLPNLTNQRQQRQLQTYIQNAEASLKALPGSNPLISAEIQLQELADCTVELNKSLVIVGHTQPMFDINYLSNEGVTNIAALDQHYMATIGTQLIADYNLYRERAMMLSGRIKMLFDKFAILKQNLTEDALADVMAEATFIHGEYIEWVESFLRIVGAGVRDIINHLNQHRLPTAQIQHPFPETNEVAIA